MGTVVQQTARPYSGQWTQLQRSSVPLSPPSWTFSLHDAPVKLPVSWRTPPIPPTVSSSSCHQEDGTRASEPAPPDCSTAFSPRLWEPSIPITSLPSETSSTTLAPETRILSPQPPSHHTPPTPHAPHENCWKPQEHCAILSVLHTGEWTGQTTFRNTLFFSLYAPDTFLQTLHVTRT